MPAPGRLVAGSFVIAAVLLAGAARAATPCAPDIEKFCPNVPIPGRGRIARCIQRHRGDLSATCEHRLRKAEQPRSE